MCENDIRREDLRCACCKRYLLNNAKAKISAAGESHRGRNEAEGVVGESEEALAKEKLAGSGAKEEKKKRKRKRENQR